MHRCSGWMALVLALFLATALHAAPGPPVLAGIRSASPGRAASVNQEPALRTLAIATRARVRELSRQLAALPRGAERAWLEREVRAVKLESERQRLLLQLERARRLGDAVAARRIATLLAPRVTAVHAAAPDDPRKGSRP